MTDEQIKSRLVSLAAEMFRGDGMPQDIWDWQLAKTTPKSTRVSIRDSSDRAAKQANEWGKRIMEIVNNK